jgi:hypothetical protein
MNESRNCQNCKTDFQIDPEDFVFYEKMKVSAPTWCSGCRMIRRMMWRNVRSLYRRECQTCKKVLISMYADDGVPVMCGDCWNGDAWDQHMYGKEINWNRDIFSQVHELLMQQPRIFQYRVGNVVNSDYGNSIVNSKDAYMSFSVIDSENVMYSESIDKSRDSIDNFTAHELDQCSWNICSDKNYNSHFLINSQSNIDSQFLFDCANCQHCCLSSNLRNQQYYFRNQKLSKEEYAQKVAELGLGSRSGFKKTTEEFLEMMQGSIHRYAQIYASVNTTGDFNINVKNSFSTFDAQNSEELKYAVRIISSKDIMDCYAVLTGELEYETISGTGNASKQIGCVLCLSSREIEYSFFCRGSANCFGCVGLKNAQYCIFNKQYTKEEYEALVPKIREHMTKTPYTDAKGRVFTYGEFYPPELSLFGYNETVAQDYFSLDENQAKEKGYKWKVRDKREYLITKDETTLPENISEVTADILQETIACRHKGECNHQCTAAFRIIDRELDFISRKILPCQSFVRTARHYQRLQYRNPMRLYRRACYNECGTVFETTYATDRPEKVYCESCYQKAVL